MKNRKCPVCGSIDMREATEFNRSRCRIQYLINSSLFCYDCQSVAIKQILANPVKSCDNCSFYNSMCAANF